MIYANMTSGGLPSPIAFLNHWSLNFSVNTIDVTSFGDTSKVFVAGLPDFQGSYSGFYDNATAQLYTAATDGVARSFYLYPDRGLITQYWYGPGIFDMSIDGTVDGAVTISGNLAGAGLVTKIG
jgi:predicted secreted protein